MTRVALALCLAAAVACGGGASSSSTAPTPVTTPSPVPAPAAAPTPQPASLSGVVTVTGTTVRISGITVKFLDGPNAGQSAATDGSGTYRFTGIQSGNANLSATAPLWAEARAGTTVDGPTTLNFTVQTIAPYSNVGKGNFVFDLPAWVTRMRIRGELISGFSSSNFIVTIGSRLVVNDLLGNFFGTLVSDGTYQTNGGTTVAITNSTAVQWTFTEVR